jgi:ribonuclease P protein component
MLPQPHRLKRHADVMRVRQAGQAYRHPLAILLVARRSAQPASGPSELNAVPASRFAFTASRRVGSAVARNRGKRVMREALRQHLQCIAPGWDCVLIVREETPRAGYADVCAAVGRLISRAGLLTSGCPD